jgi:ribosomal protein S10
MYQLKITGSSANAVLVAKKILICLFTPIHKIIPLPSKKRQFTLLKSPHINNSSKEHFKILKFQYIIHTSVSFNFIKIGLSKLSPNIQVTLKKIS